MSSQSTHPAPKGNKVIVYTRQGCHLCDDAIVQLSKVGFNPTLVDVDSDAQLTAEFGECVPVVEIDGRVRFRGTVNPLALRRLTNHLEFEDS